MGKPMANTFCKNRCCDIKLSDLRDYCSKACEKVEIANNRKHKCKRSGCNNQVQGFTKDYCKECTWIILGMMARQGF